MNFKSFCYSFFILFMLIITACSVDNYNSPKSSLHGSVVYDGEPINVRSENVTFRLFQTGFQKKTPITVQVAQDGSYKALVFDGNYQIVIPAGQGPFVQDADTINVKVSGDTQQDVNVTPYYIFNNAQVAASGRTVKASFSITQVMKGSNAKNIDYAILYVNKTKFVDDENNITSQRVNVDNLSEINISTDVPAITPIQNYVYARLGIKISGVEDKLFTKNMKLQLN